MSLFSALGGAADFVGSSLNLPELGISEALGYGTSRPSNNIVGSYGNPVGGNTTVLGSQTRAPQTGFNATEDPYSSLYNGSAVGGGGGSAPAYNSQDLAYLDDQKGLYERLLASTGTALSSGLSKLDQSKIAAENQANTQYGRQKGRLDTQRFDTQVEKEGALGQVDNNARTLYSNLRRVLGIASGSGSSAYKFAAPQAVARDASTKRGSVMSTFGKNERNLDTAFDETRIDYEDLLANIAQQRRDKEAELRQGILGQEQSLQNTLADLAGERSNLLGGDYGAARVAQQPYRDRYNSIQTELDGLPSRFASAITPRDVKTVDPTLDKYTVDRSAVNANNQTGQSQYAPYSNFLNRYRADDEENKIYG